MACGVRAAEFGVQTCAMTQPVEVDAATLSSFLVAAAVLDAPAGTVAATDLCCPLCMVSAADTALLAPED